MTSQHLAFDLGAESGRALLGHLDRGVLSLTEVRRFPNTAITQGSSLRWDVQQLWSHVQGALQDTAGTAITSVGVDAWGCDYALLDDKGAVLEPPYHYRDARTRDVMPAVFARVPRAELYRTTGIQFLPFNTLFQLYAAAVHDGGLLARAASFVTIPDLLNYWLTGRIACEYTNATTTQCLDASTRQWALPLLARLGLPTGIFPPIAEAGTVFGGLRDGVAGPAGVSIVLPACHDTGSAVASVRASGDTAFLSSGTWSLLGVETAHPIITPRGLALNFTNEGGVFGTTRLLKNIAGLWLLQRCRRDWAAAGLDLSYDAISAAAADHPHPFRSLVDPDNPTFLNPVNMPQAIRAYCARTGQVVPHDPASLARAIFESLALKYRLVLEWLEEISGRSFTTLRVIGGGAKNRLLNQLTADATGRTVVAGPVEATALGNIAMQLVATGRVASLDDARDIIERSWPAEHFVPSRPERWEQPFSRFRDYVESPCA